MPGSSYAYSTNDNIDTSLGQDSSARGAASTTLKERVGFALAAQGFVAAPVALLRGYARLGLSDGELALVLQLWSYWRDETLPCPAVSTVAASLGKTDRQVQQLIAGLRRRGLLTTLPRYDHEGSQLSNSYDLQPLLQMLEALPPATVQPSSGVLSCAGERVQRTAGVGVQHVSPNEDHPVRSLVLVSESPCPPTNTEPPRELIERLDLIGRVLGDAAVMSSRTRATRLFACCTVDTNGFMAILDNAAKAALVALPTIHRRSATGSPNGMPYFFAVLEALLEDRPGPDLMTAKSRHRRPARCTYASPTGAPSASTAAAEQSDGHPLWSAVLETLAGMLASSVFSHRVRPLRSRTGEDGALEIVAPDGCTAAWVTSQLGRRIQQALEIVTPEVLSWRVVI